MLELPHWHTHTLAVLSVSAAVSASFLIILSRPLLLLLSFSHCMTPLPLSSSLASCSVGAQDEASCRRSAGSPLAASPLVLLPPLFLCSLGLVALQPLLLLLFVAGCRSRPCPASLSCFLVPSCLHSLPSLHPHVLVLPSDHQTDTSSVYPPPFPQCCLVLSFQLLVFVFCDLVCLSVAVSMAGILQYKSHISNISTGHNFNLQAFLLNGLIFTLFNYF